MSIEVVNAEVCKGHPPYIKLELIGVAGPNASSEKIAESIKNIRQEVCPNYLFRTDCRFWGPNVGGIYTAQFYYKRLLSIITVGKLQKKAKCVPRS